MTQRRAFVLVHPTARARALEAVRSAEDGTVVELRDRTRSLDQNAKLHAMIGDVAAQCEWMGRKLSPAQWKVLFVSGHSMATGDGADMMPGLEGEYCNIRESTAAMGRRRMASLIEYVAAWGANACVHWSELDVPTMAGDDDA